MAGKMLSVEPTVDPSAKLHDTRLGAYCEVGARTILHEVVMDDYSYVVNDAQITYTTIGKFCSIAAMTRTGITNPCAERCRISANWPSRIFWQNTRLRTYRLARAAANEAPYRDRHFFRRRPGSARWRNSGSLAADR